VPRLLEQMKSIIDTLYLELNTIKVDIPVKPRVSPQPSGTTSPTLSPRQSPPDTVTQGQSSDTLKQNLVRSSLNILTRSVPKLAVSSNSALNTSALHLISPPVSPSASKLRAAVEGRMSQGDEVPDDRAETTQEAIIREARTIAKSYPKLLECARINASQEDFKCVLVLEYRWPNIVILFQSNSRRNGGELEKSQGTGRRYRRKHAQQNYH
jgi:hypothetical protein